MILRRASTTGIVLLVLFCFFLLGEGTAADTYSTPLRVVKVHDGDTVSVAVGRRRERIRLIGIDAPEIGQRPWGLKSKRHLEEILDRAGWTVTIETDVEKRDKYGRLLAYLRDRDGGLINLQMVRDGYAVLYTFPPNVKYVDLLREGQRYAGERGLGIWGRNGLKEMPWDYRKTHRR